jgi:hypothetical protein
MNESYLIDDFSDAQKASNGRCWQYFSDRVMGGVSDGRAAHGSVDGRPALQLSGRVSLANNGGFIQVALDLADGSDCFDAGAFSGVALTACGDGGSYAVNLRSSDIRRPWQSYRAAFEGTRSWQTLYLPFESFVPHRIDRPLDPRSLKRIGVIAIGEERQVELSVARMAFYTAAVNA